MTQFRLLLTSGLLVLQISSLAYAATLKTASASASIEVPSNVNNTLLDIKNNATNQSITTTPSPSYEATSKANADNGTFIEATSIKPAIKVYNKTESRKKKIEKKSVIVSPEFAEWKCPNISRNQNLECGCDMPHTLRCSGNIHGLELIASGLRASPYSVSLLDCTLKNVTFLSDAKIFENVSLHGLVISSGEIKRVHRSAFLGMASPLQALGLPNNALVSVPWYSLAPLTALDRLDLSNNRIKALGAVDFGPMQNLSFLDLSENLISSISLRTFTSLRKLQTLKLNGNRLGDFATSIQAIGQCVNLRELDLKSNSIKGPLSRNVLPSLPSLESLNLDKNLISSIQNGALQSFQYLVTLSLRHNQIDVLQDHAFSGLSSLQVLDLGYNGIVAVSGASLQHLPRLLVLDLTHNFLRALTSDLIAPLQSLKELRLDGNDISIVAKNALDGANEVKSLSLQENPLSCDCTLRPFAEWLAESKIPSQDLLGAICATPPHLEGAPLLQIPLESLNCEGNFNEYDNSNILEQLEHLSKQNNLSHVKDLSDLVTLRDIHFSTDYGLFLTWVINLRNDEFTCDAIFVYKEENDFEILSESTPIHCESSIIDGENTVSVMVPNSSSLRMGESYRFCLVIIQEKSQKQELDVGCSNITKLQQSTSVNQPRIYKARTDPTDIASIDKMATNVNDEFTKFSSKDETISLKDTTMHNKVISETSTIESHTIELFNHLNKSFLPGLGLGVLITSVFVLIWGATKLRNDKTSNPAVTTCYAATTEGLGHHLHENDNRNRYLKLQATTSL